MASGSLLSFVYMWRGMGIRNMKREKIYKKRLK
jgi:hypothetical protein